MRQSGCSRRSTSPDTFPLFPGGIDPDNPSESLNAHLVDYCLSRQITCTRSRSPTKSDGAHVRQENWDHVRPQVGSLRHDTNRELEPLDQIGDRDPLLTNYLLARQQLVEQHLHGTRTTMLGDRAQTPISARAYALSDGARAMMDGAIAGGQLAPLCDQM